MVTDSTVRGRLVLVEDDAGFRGILELLFEAAGWEVFVASDGAVGLATAERAAPDVVVTDLRMPRMSGIQLAHELATSSEASGVPVVAITSDTSTLRDEAVRSGLFVDVLTKPLSPRTLLETVRRATRAANGDARTEQ
jgi:DNA-binding response OmpR family regulator